MNAKEQHKDMTRDPRQSERKPSTSARDRNKDDNDLGDPQSGAYSAIERLRQKDFENYSWEEVQEAKRLMAEMHWNLGMRPTRRKAPDVAAPIPICAVSCAET